MILKRLYHSELAESGQCIYNNPGEPMKPSPAPRIQTRAVTILVGLFTVVFLLFVAYLLYEVSFPVKPARSISTLVFTVIPAPTATPEVAESIPNGPTSTPTAVPAGSMGIGAYVQITGTGGDGLRLRAGPGKDNAPLFL